MPDATSSASDKIQIDTGQVSGSLMYNNGTQSYNTFTEYEFQRQSHEPAGNATPTWALGRIDGPGTLGITAVGASAFPISAGPYTNTDYLEFDQTPSPTFIPSGATITSSSLALTFYETVAAGKGKKAGVARAGFTRMSSDILMHRPRAGGRSR